MRDEGNFDDLQGGSAMVKDGTYYVCAQPLPPFLISTAGATEI